MYLLVCILCLFLFLAVPVVLPIGCVVAHRHGRRLLAATLGIFCVLAFLVYARFGYENLPLGDKRVAEFRSENGVELIVHQVCNYSIEPYTTRFYYRASPSNRWHAFYMDHQDSRWVSGRIDFDEQRQEAIVRQGREAVASFNVRTREFTRGTRTTTNSLVVLAQGEEPGDEVKR